MNYVARLSLLKKCRDEGRCSKCIKLVVQRKLYDMPDDPDAYLCQKCGGLDIRIIRKSLFARLWDRFFGG